MAAHQHILCFDGLRVLALAVTALKVDFSSTGAVTGQFYCLYLIAVTKFSDMGAYLVGSVVGRHQMIPHISPKKTWEGFGGALAFSLFASVGLFKLMPGHLSLLTLTHAIVLGLLLGFAAVVGDLRANTRGARRRFGRRARLSINAGVV